MNIVIGSQIDLMRIILKFIRYSLMRARNKKIVLIESIKPYQPERDYKFVDHTDHQMSMRIVRNQTENQGSLAEIFYEALLNQSIGKRETERVEKTPQTLKIVNSAMLPTDASEKRCNSGRIVRRSLSKNGSNCASPEHLPKEVIKMQSTSTQLGEKSRVGGSVYSSRLSSKENCKLTPSTEKTIKSSRRSISNKKQIKYTVKPHFRS